MPVTTRFLTAETISAQLIEKELARGDSGALFPEEPYPTGLLSGSPRSAAVLIPLLRADGDWHVLFTRRTSTLAEHSGQVAFPGGRADEHDPGPEMTALREASEEIGLAPKDVRILGQLNDFLTITNYRVTPVVGLIPWPYALRPQTGEVERIFTIPLDWLAEPGNHTIQPRQLPAPYPPVNVIYFKPYDGEILWGASARFTLTLLQNLRLIK
jgi:8-oxo-dGTP pyrophosphatase MutT (NUDIX family)